MDYLQTLEYLYSQLPVFTRDGASAYKANLDNTIELCKRLGNPQDHFKSVHVGGTNGKGSTSHMLAAILQTAGYKTGLYTSPHLKDFRERIRINGQMISEQKVIDFVAKHQPDFEDIKPSFFEMTVGLAFQIFAEEKVDIAIIEVGLGGRLDSTNIITPLLSIVTNIGWDHMNILGDSLQLIAAEKAGIIKPKVPVIIGEYQPEVAGTFTNKAKQENSSLTFASKVWETKISEQEIGDKKLEVEAHHENFINPAYKQDFLTLVATKISNTGSHNTQHATENRQHTTGHPLLAPRSFVLALDLPGTYQLKNVKAVLCAIDELRSQGFKIGDNELKAALSQVKTLTGLHGRWETISTNPLTICDTGHNPEGIAEVLKNIVATPHQQLHFVMGVVNDKDITKILAMLPASAIYYFCKPDIPRGLEAKSLKLKAESYNLSGDDYPSVKAALSAAQKAAKLNDLVFAGGSTFVVAEVV